MRAGSSREAHASVLWARSVRLRLSPWQTRAIGDVILPTVPMRAGADVSLAALRQHVQREREAQLPAAFKMAETKAGFVLEVSTPPTQALQWRIANGPAAALAIAAGTRAEIAWTESAPPLGAIYELSDGTHMDIARIHIALDGEPALQAVAGVRAWLLVEVSRAEADRGRGDFVSRFAWRAVAERPVESTLPPLRSSLTPDAHRLEFPLDSPAAPEVTRHTLILADVVTNWTLFADLEQTPVVQP